MSDKVQRYTPMTGTAASDFLIEMRPVMTGGEWVRAEDYDAALAQLAEYRRYVEVQGFAKWCPRCMVTVSDTEKADLEIHAPCGGLVWRVVPVEVVAKLAHERAVNHCDACGGTGKPVSGGACMCGGSGRMSDAALTLRADLAAERTKLAASEARCAIVEAKNEELIALGITAAEAHYRQHVADEARCAALQVRADLADEALAKGKAWNERLEAMLAVAVEALTTVAMAMNLDTANCPHCGGTGVQRGELCGGCTEMRDETARVERALASRDLAPMTRLLGAVRIEVNFHDARYLGSKCDCGFCKAARGLWSRGGGEHE